MKQLGKAAGAAMGGGLGKMGMPKVRLSPNTAKGGLKNVIKAAIQPDHKEYAALMGQPARMSSPASAALQSATPSAPGVPTRPAWAQ